MKKLFLIFYVSVISLPLYAQDCGHYYYMQNNETVEIGIYDRKGNANGKSVYHISGVENNGDGASSNIHSEVYDKHGKLLTAADMKFKCTGGVFYIDMQSFIPSSSLEAFKDMQITANGSDLEYPANINVGDNLKDGTLIMDIYKKGTDNEFAKVNLNIYNRKVEGKENVTTPAGSWDCYKISFDYLLKITMMGIGIPVNMKEDEWFAPDFGIVKSEAYTKRGKLMGSTLLNSITK